MRETAFLSKFFSGKHFITTRSQVFMGDFLKIFKTLYRTSVNSSFQHNGPSHIPHAPLITLRSTFHWKLKKKKNWKPCERCFRSKILHIETFWTFFFCLYPVLFFLFFCFFCLCPWPTRSPWETLTVWSNFEFIAPHCSGVMLFFVDFKACVHYFLKTHDPSDLIT